MTDAPIFDSLVYLHSNESVEIAAMGNLYPRDSDFGSVVTDQDIADEVLKQGWMDDNEVYNAILSTLRFMRYNFLERDGENWKLC